MFFVICLIAVAVSCLVFQCRVRALTFGTVGLLAGFTIETIGVFKDEWGYETVDSLLKVTGIPIEVLFGYFTAAFFIVVLIDNIPDISTERRRELIVTHIYLMVGIVLLAYTYTTSSMSLAVGWAFLGLYGLSISPDRSVPLTVGIIAFFADWVVEGVLTAGTQYYSQGWDPTIALVFMFVAMFVTGLLMNQETIGSYLSSKTTPGTS